ARGTCPRCMKPIKGFGLNKCGLPFDYDTDVADHLDDLVCVCCGYTLGRSPEDSAWIVFDCDCWEALIPELPEPAYHEYTAEDLERELSGVEAWHHDELRERNMKLAIGKSRF